MVEDTAYAHQQGGVDALPRKDIVDVSAVAMQMSRKPGDCARAGKHVKFPLDKLADVYLLELGHKGLF